jgi:hypothetical protein
VAPSPVLWTALQARVARAGASPAWLESSAPGGGAARGRSDRRGHDLATDLQIAEAASARYGGPLCVIENVGDDPALEQPEAFLKALPIALGSP